MLMLQIKKRNGELVAFNPSKILTRIKKAAKGLKSVNSDEIFIKVITSTPTEGIVETKVLDSIIAITAASYTTSHPEYSELASAIAVSSHHKDTSESFYETMKLLANQNIVNPVLIKIIEDYGSDNIQNIIDYEKDYIFDFFGWKALEDIYLLKDSNGKIVERPQQMYMRVALWCTHSFEEAIEYYNLLSNQLVSPATPIMINSGTKNAQLASCVLVYNEDDSRKGLLNTLNDISEYSADAAGIGLCMTNIRSKENTISTSGGKAGGLLKYLKIVNESLRFFNQQGRRPGAAAIYIEPWHKDIFDFLEIKKPTGQEELRARDIFTALWIPDNFMNAVKEDKDYYLFCPNDIKKAGLKPFQEIYGEEFEEEYQKAIDLGIGAKVKAKDIWIKIYESEVESGTPYILFKDSINKKSNQKNIGVVKSSNLCAEITEVTDKDTTAICTLSSVILKNYVKDKKFDFNQLYKNVKAIVSSLNKVIDINHYSTIKGKKGGLEQRALAIGVQGLADAMYLMDLEFTSEEGKQLNKLIFETIYYAALRQSCDLVINKEYLPYQFFEGSPYSKGIFQFDMWGVKANELSGLCDWEQLREDIQKYGLCNSLVTAIMPTASSAKITGSYESMEPMHANLFVRKVLGGAFVIPNKYLISDLDKLGIWCEELKNEIIVNNGSIQKVKFLSYLNSEDKKYEQKVKRIEYLLKKYKTVWEISQKELISMAADRGLFIDQTQSMNIYMAEPTLSKITSSHFYAWEKGLKTGMYYLRTKPISTGAKHLAIDMKNEPGIAKKSTQSETDDEKEMRLLNERIAEEMKNIPSKPLDSNFECFGCGS